MFIRTLAQVTLCNPGNTNNEKPMDNYNLTLQFPQEILIGEVHFNSLLGLYSSYLYCCGSVSPLSSLHSSRSLPDISFSKVGRLIET